MKYNNAYTELTADMPICIQRADGRIAMLALDCTDWEADDDGEADVWKTIGKHYPETYEALEGEWPIDERPMIVDDSRIDDVFGSDEDEQAAAWLSEKKDGRICIERADGEVALYAFDSERWACRDRHVCLWETLARVAPETYEILPDGKYLNDIWHDDSYRSMCYDAYFDDDEDLKKWFQSAEIEIEAEITEKSNSLCVIITEHCRRLGIDRGDRVKLKLSGRD